jgi:uncharacterized protein (UPF0335 family)
MLKLRAFVERISMERLEDTHEELVYAAQDLLLEISR